MFESENKFPLTDKSKGKVGEIENLWYLLVSPNIKYGLGSTCLTLNENGVRVSNSLSVRAHQYKLDWFSLNHHNHVRT